MDSVDATEDGYNTRRRSARQASKTGFSSAGLTRPKLKRTRRMREDDGEPSAVNGSNESKSLGKGDDDDGDSPDKKRKLEDVKNEGDINEAGDGLNHTDVDMDENEDQDQEMSSDEEAQQDRKIYIQVPFGTEEKHPARVQEENPERESIVVRRRPIQNLEREPIVVSRMPIQHPEREPTVVRRLPIQHPEREPIVVGQMPITQKTVGHERLRPKIENDRLKRTTQDVPHRVSWNSCPPSQNQNIFAYQKFQHPVTNRTAHHKNTEMKNLPEPVTSKASPVSSSRGGVWNTFKCFLWLLILIGLLALSFLAYQKFHCSHLPQTDVVRSESFIKFGMKVAELQALFPSQRSVLWKRTEKHLKRHLETAEHTEPVSMILTAGLQAERTLGCLARSLATVYSAFHNASIVEINGTTKRAQDSDRVKLEIDEALRKAFEGDKPAAVVHHFEELPPGSTLIFYRYCDHENAAYKNVFLVFTVMLSVNEIEFNESLSTVEYMVHDHVKEKFITSDKSAMFNQMDVDKLSGLWSRISHLILPVVAEENIEQQGCDV